MTTDISYFHTGDNNALMGKVAELGYLPRDARILDATYGEGTWWRTCDLENLVTNDLDSPIAEHSFDFCEFPEEWQGWFDVVAYDPPYRLNGTPDPAFDTRYGTHLVTTEAQVMATIRAGLEGCAACVRPRGHLLVKCQAQVCSGRVVWQDVLVIQWAHALGFTLVERFDMAPARPQPPGRRQVHARRGSTLLIFRKGK